METMKKRIVLLVVLAFIIVLVFSISGKAVASPKFPVFTLTETFCSAGYAERSWFAGLTHHGRNATYTAVAVSDNPARVYDEIDTVNWDINLVTMKGVAWGTYEQTDTDANSSDGWQGTWNSEMEFSSVVMEGGVPLWLNKGKGEGHGTGSFFGMLVKFEYVQSVEVFDSEPSGYPCVTGQTIDGDYFVLQQQVNGYIIGLP